MLSWTTLSSSMRATTTPQPTFCANAPLLFFSAACSFCNSLSTTRSRIALFGRLFHLFWSSTLPQLLLEFRSHLAFLPATRSYTNLTTMNSHTTPRPGFPVRSMGGGSGHPPQSRQPVAPQVSNNEEYSTIPEEDREHIDEVVGCAPMMLQQHSTRTSFAYSRLFFL